MKFYQLVIALKTKQDIYYDEVTEKLSILFSKSMLYHHNLKSMHELNQYKLYVFEGLSPFERDKIYKKDRIYTTNLRCMDEGMAEDFKNCLKQTNTNEFDVVAVDINTYTIIRNIRELYTITPAIATIDGRPWKEPLNIDILKNSINTNLINKFKAIKGIEYPIPEHNMIKDIELKNIKPIAFKYKNIKLIGNKFSIQVNQDELSQEMARIAVSTGLLEKNSLGYGYCLYK